MITIVLAYPRTNPETGTYSVYGVSEGNFAVGIMDGLVFDCHEFPGTPEGKALAEIKAKRMMEEHCADHFERCTGELHTAPDHRIG